mmetsp:Transcript_7590/g.17371  ORF Transcript_7590/g.17371 Transcript_7590/m.17371 type:complete len:362 (+) Transcript_7590:49-1134(+)
MVRPRWRLATLIPLAVTAATVVLTARPIESNETDPHGPPGAQCAGTAGECVGENELPPQFDAMDRPADDEGETSSSSEDDDEGKRGEEGPSSGPSAAATAEYESSTGSDLFGSKPSNGEPRESRTLFELWSNLRCNDVFKTERPIPTKELFSGAIGLYNSIQDDPKLRIENKGAGGIFVELEVRQAGDKGRGIFALEDIPKGAKWRSSYDFTATFYHPNHYRSFLLGLERGTACDVMQWAYAEWDAVTDEAYIGVDLDEATMCNDGGEGSNVGCDEEDPDMDCMAYHYAMRDIKKEEEILCDYAWHSGSAWDETVWKWKLDPVHEKASLTKRLRRFVVRVRRRTSQIRRKLLSKREASVGN